MLDAKNAGTKAKLVSVLVAGGLILAVALLALRVGPPTVWAHVVPQPCDFTTGGGFVFKDDGNRVNFGIVGGCKNGGFFGHVNVVDHGFDPPGHLNGPVTAYFDPFPDGPSGYRDLCGTGSLNDGSTVQYRIRTKDNGEPGSLDRFGIKVAGIGYIVSTRDLGPPGPTDGGGNIQLHKPNPSTTGPANPPDEITACGGDDSGLGQ